jgi:hypothetical protein
MNALLSHYIETRPMYCHVLELATSDELKSVLDNAWEAYIGEGWDEKTTFEFLRTLEVIYYTDGEENEAEEEELYNLSIGEYLMENHVTF